MKNLMVVFFAVVAVLAGFNSANAMSLSAETGMSSGYLYRGWMVYDDPVSQSELKGEWENGLYGKAWVSTDLNDSRFPSSVADENMYTGGLKKSFEIYEFDLSASYDRCYRGEIEEDEDGNIVEPPNADMYELSVKLGSNFKDDAEKNTLSPWVEVDVWNSVKSDGPKGGAYFMFGLNHKSEISESIEFEHEARFVYDSGVYDADEGIIFEYDISVAYSFMDNYWIAIIGQASTPLTPHDERKAKAVGGISAGFKF